MLKKVLVGVVVMMCFCLMIVEVVEAYPISIQGKISSTGTVRQSVNAAFTLWDALSGGTKIAGPINKNGLQVDNGIFNTTLDFGNDVKYAFYPYGYYLDISIGGTSLTPRQLLTAAPYASANVLKTGDTLSGPLVVNATTSIYGVRGSATTAGIRGEGIAGVSGWSSATGADGGVGVDGQSIGTGASMGGKFQSTNGIGVYGKGAIVGGSFESAATGVSGKGVLGVYGNGTAVGGSFESIAIGVAGRGSTGIYGKGNLFGGSFESVSTGVYGKGATIGGSFESSNGTGIMVTGYYNAITAYSSGNGIGVYGSSNGGEAGVYANNTNAYGTALKIGKGRITIPRILHLYNQNTGAYEMLSPAEGQTYTMGVVAEQSGVSKWVLVHNPYVRSTSTILVSVTASQATTTTPPGVTGSKTSNLTGYFSVFLPARSEVSYLIIN